MSNHIIDHIWVTAEHIHTGQKFLTEQTYIKVSRQGQILDISTIMPQHEPFKYFDGILAPGFINAHCHLELSHLLGVIEPGHGLVNFLLDVMKPQNKSVTTDIINQTIHDAYQKGIIAYGDIANTTNSFEAKSSSKIHFHTFIEALGKIDSKAASNYAHFCNIAAEFEKITHQRHATSLTIHAPYSISNELAHLVDSHKKGALLSIHSQECAAETELFMQRTGAFLDFYKKMNIPQQFTDDNLGNSLDWILHHISDDHRLLLIHNTFAKEEDWQKIADRPHTHICLCPKANLYIENTLPPIDKMMNVITNICIGTDSLASNDNIDICSEMKTIHDHFPEISIEKIISWATYQGAQALGWQHLGEIKVGNNCHLVNISKDLSESQLIV